MSAIELFELQSAKEVWENLPPDLQKNLLFLEDGRALFRKPLPFGVTNYRAEYEEIDPRFEPLIELKLAVKTTRAIRLHSTDGRELSWGLSGPPYEPAYLPTTFGKLVQRYGTAVTLVELAKGTIG